MGYIYLVTNKVNGKRYVGQTQRMDIQMRWADHRRMSPTSIGSYLLAAYRKHGIPNFKFEIICICFNEDCDRYEEEYIKKYDTLAPNGYNIRCTGNSVPVSEETRQLIGKRMKELMTDERRKAISELHKGKIISDEHREALSSKAKERWNNMTEDEKNEYMKKLRNTEVSNRSIEGLKKWRELNGNPHQKRVGKYDIDNNLLETFVSVSDASRKTNISRVTISKVCLEKPNYKTAGGFVWKFI